MKFHDRRWIRELRKRIRPEVRKSKRLREISNPVFTRNRSASPIFGRLFFAAGWILAGWFFADDGRVLRALPYWAWLIFLNRWVKHGQFANFAAWLRHLPIRREDVFAHLWNLEWRSLLILGIEFEAVLGPWLHVHGFGVWGWVIALPISALVAAATFVFATAAFVFLGGRSMSVALLATVCFAAILVFGWRISYEFVQNSVSAVESFLTWLTPGGWTVEAARLLPTAPWRSALFLGAALCTACTLPILRRRLWADFRNLDFIGAPWRPDQSEEEEDYETASKPPQPGETLSPEEEDIVKGEVIAALQVSPAERTSSTPPAAQTAVLPPRTTRWILLYQLLAGDLPEWRRPLINAVKYAAGGLVLLFVVRMMVPSLSQLAFGLWGTGFALGYLPILGGMWPGLSSSGSASRIIPYISLVPVGTWELARVMFISNCARLAVFGTLAVLAGVAGAVIIGFDPVESAIKANLTFAMVALLQPVAIACQFMNASRMSGCLNLLLVLPFVLLGIALCIFVVLVFVDGTRALKDLLPFIAAVLGILYILSAILMWRYSRRKMDVIR